MVKTYSESKLIRTSNADFKGVWRVSDIMATMQEVSGMHSELLGVGRSMLIKQNIVWVLSRSELIMDRYPSVGETITIETFPMKNRRWFFPRYFIIRDNENNIIGRAGTLWLLMDYIERKMVGPETVLPFMPDNTDMDAPLALPGNIDDIDDVGGTFVRMPVYTDLDVNQHVNNTRYADWLCDALGINVMRDNDIEHLLIHYTHEILPHQQMQITLQCNGNSFRLSGLHEDVKHFEIGGVLKKRENEPL